MSLFFQTRLFTLALQNPFGAPGASAQAAQSPFGGFNAFGASSQQGGQPSPFGNQQAGVGAANLFGQQQQPPQQQQQQQQQQVRSCDRLPVVPM